MPCVRPEFGHTGPCWEPMLSWFGEPSLRWAVSGPSCWVRDLPVTASGVDAPVQVGVDRGTQGVSLMGWPGFVCLHLDTCAPELLKHKDVQDNAV